MDSLLQPIKNRHQYVIGIDFGHGETSAAICAIEWDKDAGQRESSVTDIDMDIPARKKVIPSAICRLEEGELIIGDEVFEHLSDNNGIRLAFKQQPFSIEGEKEQLMVDYMRAIYHRIRESRPELTDDNHIVYIARPSGWVDKQCKQLYCQMAIQAGLPLGGLTSESRAAIFFARNVANFANDITQGAIVFDLGSSTLDFTYLAEDNIPIDYGYKLGAHLIDETILNNMILNNEDVREFINRYPAYQDALLFKARKFKEEVYSRNESSKTVSGFPLSSIIPETEASFEAYEDIYVKLRVNNMEELNQMIESRVQYISKLRKAMIDFRDQWIPGRPVNGVFLTGGASRMNFIRPLIAEVFSLSEDRVKIDNDNPSLTISRGIALLGTTDAITSVLMNDLRASLPSIIKEEISIDRLVDQLSKHIVTASWKIIEDTCADWIKNGKTTNDEELKKKIKKNLEEFKNHSVTPIVNEVVKQHVNQGSEEIRKKMNQIICRYAPGREIKLNGNVQIGEVEAIHSSLDELSKTIATISDDVIDGLGDVILVFVIFVFLGWYFILKSIFSTDEETRKDKADQLLRKKDSICKEATEKICAKLNSNESFKLKVTRAMSTYFTEQMERNLKQVIIPIE